MEMILHLQNLSQVATSLDIRHFFGGLDIPVGGVQIVGGEDGDAFINFCSEQDLLQALTFENKPLLGQRVKLFLAKEDDVHRVIEKRNRELDRAKANFIAAAVDTEEIGNFKDHPFDKRRIDQTDQNRPSSSYRFNAGDDQDRLSSSHRTYRDYKNRASGSHRTCAYDRDLDYRDQPSGSHKTYGDDVDQPSRRHISDVDDQERLACSPKNLFDEDERFQVDPSHKIDADNRFKVQDHLSSTNRAYSDVDENSQDQDQCSGEDQRYSDQNPHRSPSYDPTNVFVEAIYQLLEGDSSRVKSHSKKRSGDHNRDPPSHSDKKLKLEEGDKVVTLRAADLKKRQEAKSQNQKPVEIGQSQSVGSANEDSDDYDDRDDRPQRHQSSHEGTKSRGKRESTEHGKTGDGYKSREKERERIGVNQDITRNRDKGESSKGKQASQDVYRNRDRDDKGLRAKHAGQDISRSRDRKDKNMSTERADKSTRSRDRVTRGYAKEDKSKDKDKKRSDRHVKKEQQREKNSSRDRSSNPNRQNTDHHKIESESGYHTKEHKIPKLDCIGLYHLDVTVTATDIRKFLKLWEIPDGGIILRADKHNPNALIAYVKYYPKKSVDVKSLINTILNGRPIDIKSLPMEIFHQEKLIDHKIEETPPASLAPPAPATGRTTYFPPPPRMYPRPMGMPRMPMPWYGPPRGIMGPLRGIMGPPRGMMGLFPPQRGMMPLQRMDFSQGMPPHPSLAWPPFPEESSLGPSNPGPSPSVDMKPLHYIQLNPDVLPANCTASEVWSWFDGPSGPAEHAILVADDKRVPVLAFVAFLKESKRNEEKAARKKLAGVTCTHSRMSQVLSHAKKGMLILQSSESGVDKDMSDVIQFCSYMELNPDVLPPQCSACEVWSWFGGPNGPAKHAILVTTEEHVAVVAFVGFFEEYQRDKEIAARKELKGAACLDYSVSKVLFGMKKMVVLQSTLSGVDRKLSGEAKPDSHTTPKIPLTTPRIPPTTPRIPPTTPRIPPPTPRIPPIKPEKSKEKSQLQPTRQLISIV